MVSKLSSERRSLTHQTNFKTWFLTLKRTIQNWCFLVSEPKILLPKRNFCEILKDNSNPKCTNQFLELIISQS